MGNLRKIGLIGEDPSDKKAIKNLLSQKYSHQFVDLLKHQTGDNLETSKTQRMLSVELKNNSLDLVIFIRDLDAYETNEVQLRKRTEWFNRLKSHFKGTSIFC